MQTSQSNQSILQSRPASLASTVAQLAGAALLGVFIVYGVGFTHIMPVHNAAHDVRHSAAFPCH